VDQYADDPQSWNLYSYVRNNPLSNIDPSGQDCITTSNQTDASVTVTVASGTCNGKGGAYVNGTVDLKSLTYNGTSVGYSYTSYDANTIFGTGTVGLGSSGNIGALSPYGQEFYNQMSARRAANNGTIATFAAGQALFAAAYASIPAVVAGLTAMGETGALGPGVGLLKLAQRYGLNANSPKARQLLENLDMKVEDFVGKYRLGSIKQAEGWKFDGMTVKQALDAGGRKLLTDGRFDK
jgi:hypothetical protein